VSQKYPLPSFATSERAEVLCQFTSIKSITVVRNHSAKFTLDFLAACRFLRTQQDTAFMRLPATLVWFQGDRAAAFVSRR
jgi:hypothetical protein